MDEKLVASVIVIVLVIRAFVCIFRLVIPEARGVRTAKRELLGCLGWFIALVVLAMLILPAQPRVPEIGRRVHCLNNMKQIVLAMHNYRDKYGCFPPAYTVDKSGLPLHSWRVLLLPYLDQRDLFDRVRLDEPYDSPWNRTLFESVKMPPVFWCPSDKENRTDANYVLVVGPRTISNGPNSVRMKDITDGASNTIAVVETYDFCVRWYEPRDLPADRMSFKINDPEYIGIASRHVGGAQVAFADQKTRFLPNDIDPRMVEAMTTINGGEDVSEAMKGY